MALVSASSYRLWTHCLTQYPYYSLRKTFFKRAFFSGRLGEEFSSLSLPPLISSDLERNRKEKHTTKVCMIGTLSLSSRALRWTFKICSLCSHLRKCLLSSAGLKNSLTPSYVKQFLTELKAIMKCVGLPLNTFLIKPMCPWVENFPLSRRGNFDVVCKFISFQKIITKVPLIQTL